MRKEIIATAGMTLAAIGLANFAFSSKQRQWIIDRDGDKCVAPFPHAEDTTHPKQVHHIKPQGYLKKVAPEVSPDFPENGITLCRSAHEIIHPDIPGARHNYSQDNGSFGKLREQRTQKLNNREIYWNPEYDRQMEVIALRNTRKHEKYYKFPEK